MSDPTAVLPPLTLIPTSSPVGVRPTATTDDDLAMARLAIWLAEVSAEATMRPAARDVEPPRAETAS
jgi:hypothetical protein